MERKAGVLMHVSSLPGKYGIGSLGKAAYEFVDFLAAAGLSLWQVLPLCPTSYGDSPYQSPSVFAGNPYFIDLDARIDAGLLCRGEVREYRLGSVDYAALYAERYDTLRIAFGRFIASPQAGYAEFKAKHGGVWLDDYALFMAIKEANGMRAWESWADEYKYRTADMNAFADAAEFYKFLQYEFYTQWQSLKAYANGRGVSIIGDMPIYVAYDSVDVWSNPRQFMLDADLSRKTVAGVPPDYFSATGQLWGNPLYDWEYMAERGYDWWIARMRNAFDMYDVVRIDHFRAFADYYSIPAGRDDACVGEWLAGPGKKFFDAVEAALGKKSIIAEDLGELHDCVRELVAAVGFPGMKVLQFAFDGNPHNEFLYTNYPENCVAYTGTHDNDTTRGWFDALDDNGKATVRRTIGYEGNAMAKTLVQRLFASNADTVIVPMQDLLNAPTSARMNIPSTTGGNWSWRSQDKWTAKAASIRKLVEKTKRI